jgi:hypothetical protein
LSETCIACNSAISLLLLLLPLLLLLLLLPLPLLLLLLLLLLCFADCRWASLLMLDPCRSLYRAT